MRALDRKLWRDLWRIRGQVLAIATVVGAGVAVLLMSLGTLNSLEETRAAYYERYGFADVFAHVKRAPEQLARRIARIPGVRRAETRIVQDVTLDIHTLSEPASARLISLGERDARLNRIALQTGRYPDPARPDQVVVSGRLAAAHGLAPGSELVAVLNGRRRSLEVVGTALSPEYVYAIGPGALVPDDRLFGILWMGRPALAAAFDLEGGFNDVSLALMRDASEVAVVAELDGLLDRYGGIGAYGRDDQLSHAYLDGEMEQLAATAGIMPPIFLVVAAFLLNVVTARLVETEREQIGLLKACGYTNIAVGLYYLKFVMIIAGLGVILGAAVGAMLGHTVTRLYADLFQFPFLYYRPQPAVFALAAVASLGAAGLGTIGAVRRAIALPPAVAMRPAPPMVCSSSE